jgi:hypothetical protein
LRRDYARLLIHPSVGDSGSHRVYGSARVAPPWHRIQGRVNDVPQFLELAAGAGRLDEAAGQCQAGQVRATAAAGLVPDRVQVGADGADSDGQLVGDLGLLGVEPVGREKADASTSTGVGPG